MFLNVPEQFYRIIKGEKNSSGEIRIGNASGEACPCLIDSC